jgi:Major capsid protein N-terminus
MRHILYLEAFTSDFTSCAMDDELQELSNSGFDTNSSCTVHRYGDLIARITLEVTLPAIEAPAIPAALAQPATTTTVNGQVVTTPAATGNFLQANTGAHYVNSIGFALWDEIDIEIGGSTIDQLYSDFAMIYEELAGRAGLRLEEAIGRVPYRSEVDEDLIERSSKQQVLHVPLPLWFSKYQPQTWGLALPS